MCLHSVVRVVPTDDKSERSRGYDSCLDRCNQGVGELAES